MGKKQIAGKNDTYLREHCRQMEASCQAALRAHLGNDIIFIDTWAEASEERELDKEELLEEEVSAAIFTIGSYSVRISERRDLDEPDNTFTEVYAKYNLGGEMPVDRWISVDWPVDRIDYICTMKQNAAIPDEQASLFIFIDIPDSRETVREWHEITPDGVEVFLSYGLCPRNMTDAELAAEVYEACCQFCKQIGAVRVYDETNAEDLLRVYADLYAKLLYLPRCFILHRTKMSELLHELDSDETKDNAFHHLFRKNGCDVDFHKLQAFVAEHKIDDESARDVYGALFADVYDLYPPISAGMRFYEHGYIEYALKEWSEMFHIHWRWHIANSIRLLEKICQRIY